MNPEVQDAIFAWLAGLVIGAIPLISHIFAHTFVKTAPGGGGSWIADVVFLTIGTTGASFVTLVGRPGARHALRGRAAPLLMVLVAIVMVLSSILYGADVTGNAAAAAQAGANGLLVAGLILSLYLELTIAARMANARYLIPVPDDVSR